MQCFILHFLRHVHGSGQNIFLLLAFEAYKVWQHASPSIYKRNRSLSTTTVMQGLKPQFTDWSWEGLLKPRNEGQTLKQSSRLWTCQGQNSFTLVHQPPSRNRHLECLACPSFSYLNVSALYDQFELCLYYSGHTYPKNHPC